MPAARAADAVAVLERHHPGTRPIGRVSAEAGTVTVPTRGLRYA